MKKTLCLLSVLLAAGFASAQEQLSYEQVLKAARAVTAATGELKDAQVKLELNLEKAGGIKGREGIGLLVIPDKGLTADVLAKAGKETVPVGQLWLRGVALFKEGSIMKGDKVRQVTVREKETETRLQLFLLGVRRAEKGPELVIFAKDKEPLLIVPMEAADEAQDLPIELAGKGEKGKEESAALIVKLVGKFKAAIPIRPSKD